MIALHAPQVHSLAVHGLLGAPLACGAVLIVFGLMLWHHEHHFQRFTLWLFTAGSACLTVAIPGFLGSLAGEVATRTGLTVLIIAFVVVGITWWLVAVRSAKKSRLAAMLQKVPGAKQVTKQVTSFTGSSGPGAVDRYRRVGSVMVALLAGIIFDLVYDFWHQILKLSAASAAGAARALLQSSHRVSSGQAAASVHPSNRPGILIVAGVVLLVFYLILRSHEKRKNKAALPQRGGPRAIGGGSARGPIAMGGGQ